MGHGRYPCTNDWRYLSINRWSATLECLAIDVQAQGGVVRGEIQEQIEILYSGDIPDRIIDGCIKMARVRDLPLEQAAVNALTGTYTMYQIDARCLTPRGYETLIQSMNNMRQAAQDQQPDNETVLAAYDSAIENLQACYAAECDSLLTFRECWNLS